MSRWRLDAGQIEVVDEAVAEILRRKTPAERVAMISAANRLARQIVEGGVRTRYPKWTDEEVRVEVLRRLALGAS
jgi:hypothetical protein